jgi:radical SAM-linked protein
VARTPDGPPPPPPVQRLRLRYAKRGRLRFASHRDFQRSFERAMRRAGVPIAFSAGFSPHPKVSYANAAPTGAASEAEYLEMAVVERCDPARLQQALDASLPPGLDVVEVVEARTKDFADRLEASQWRIELPDVDPSVLEGAVADLLAQDAVEVERLTKNGLRRFDARGAVLAAEVVADVGGGDPERAVPGSQAPCAILQVVVRHLSPAVRPDDVLAALRETSGLTPPVTPRVTRLAQGPLDPQTGRPGDPLAPDRRAADVDAPPPGPMA